MRESPYLELREYFRLSDKSPLTLTFRQIEQILGDSLPAEAYFYDAFWYENMPGMTSPMWRGEGYPFHALIPDEIDYYISDSWTSQGYEIKALHRHDERVVFRRVVTGVSGVRIPRALTARKLPDALVYKLERAAGRLTRLSWTVSPPPPGSRRHSTRTFCASGGTCRNPFPQRR
ncbi:hypothetical protein AALD01_20165 [Oscillospiraceae bacterium 21-37]